MDQFEPKNTTLKSLLPIVCAIVMGITLTAGLWPFSFHPKNQVRWTSERDGLFFGDTGMLISEGNFGRIPGKSGISIEIWLEPKLSWASSTILSFYDPGIGPRMQVRQSGDDLVFQRFRGPGGNLKKQPSIFVDHVFAKNERTLVTLTATENGLDLYVDGALKKSVKSATIQGEDFAGILIVANAPYGNLSWKGTYRGLAFYDRALPADEVQRNFSLWKRGKDLLAQTPARPYSLYLFNENSGERLHNTGKAGPDLLIPRSYFIYQPGFLVPFWKEFRPSREYLKDVAINIFGLVPLGVCFSALFAWRSGRKRGFLYATLLGLGVSFTIELLQSFMPTRFSGTTDLITNTSGAAMGALLYLNSYTQRWLQRAGLLKSQEHQATLSLRAS